MRKFDNVNIADETEEACDCNFERIENKIEEE
jgi:hypothetical protein